MSEALTLALLVVACAALLWRQPVGAVASGAAGLALAGATMTRTVAVIVMLPAAIALVARAGKGSRSRALSFVIAGALPLAAYAAWFHAENGRYVTRWSLRPLPVRPNRDVRGLLQPSGCRPRAPLSALRSRWASDGTPTTTYGSSSRFSVPAQSPKHSRERVAGRFAGTGDRRSAARLRPRRTVAEDVLRRFAPVRRTTRPGEALWRWQFQPHHPLSTPGLASRRTSMQSLCGTEQPDTAEARSLCGIAC